MIALNIALLVVSIALTTLILLQARSAGLGAALGGSAEGMYVRRGGERRIFQATTVLAAAFILIALTHLFVR